MTNSNHQPSHADGTRSDGQSDRRTSVGVDRADAWAATPGDDDRTAGELGQPTAGEPGTRTVDRAANLGTSRADETVASPSGDQPGDRVSGRAGGSRSGNRADGQDVERAASFGGGAASAATMDLLWGTKPPPSRGRKPGMTVERIVGAAVAIADAEGLAALSMRRVADDLGVGTMSLYRYLPGKTELYELMLDAVMAENGLPDPDPDGWRAGLTAFARRSLAGYRRHPWLLEASTSRGLMGPNQTAVLDALLRTIAGIGLTGGQMMAVVGVLVSYVQGRARQQAEAARAEVRSGVSDEQFWHDFAPLLDPYLDADRFPTLAAIWRDESLTWADEFEFGLARVLDGIETFVNRDSDDVNRDKDVNKGSGP